jgi:hypothetical protein
VPASDPLARYIEHLSDHGITSGCGKSRFCPNDPVTRGQMAIFVLRAIDHATGDHIAGYHGYFADVPAGHPYVHYIEHAYDHGITSGCTANPRRYCPDAPVSRAQMAVFLVNAFGF